MKVCLLHVGTHKTGTTSIQQLFSANASAFARRGIYLPRSGRPAPHVDASGGQHNIAWELNGDPRFDPSAGTLLDLIGEISSVPHPLSVVSSEDFEYLHAKPQVLAETAATFERASITVWPLIYLRSQSRYAVSLYAELLKHGLDTSFDYFIERIREDGAYTHRGNWTFQFRYSILVDAFASAFGAERTIVRSYRSSPEKHLLRDVLSVVERFETPPPLWRLRVPARLNSSQSTSRGEALPLEDRFRADNERVEKQWGIEPLDSDDPPATETPGPLRRFAAFARHCRRALAQRFE